jgi:hypothetical protein
MMTSLADRVKAAQLPPPAVRRAIRLAAGASHHEIGAQCGVSAVTAPALGTWRQQTEAGSRRRLPAGFGRPSRGRVMRLPDPRERPWLSVAEVAQIQVIGLGLGPVLTTPAGPLSVSSGCRDGSVGSGGCGHTTGHGMRGSRGRAGRPGLPGTAEISRYHARRATKGYLGR